MKNRIFLTGLIFFTGAGVLYFGFNSVFLTVCQFFIYCFSILILLIIGYNATFEEKKVHISKSDFISGLFLISLLSVLIFMLVYYFYKTNPANLIFVDKQISYSKIISLLITLKSVFIENILSYVLVMISFTASVTGICILIPKDKIKKISQKEQE